MDAFIADSLFSGGLVGNQDQDQAQERQIEETDPELALMRGGVSPEAPGMGQFANAFGSMGGNVFGGGESPIPAASGRAGGFGSNRAGGGTTSTPATGGGLFGASTPATGGGLFGSTTSTPASGGGLFGGTTSTPASGGGGLGSGLGGGSGFGGFGSQQDDFSSAFKGFGGFGSNDGFKPATSVFGSQATAPATKASTEPRPVPTGFLSDDSKTSPATFSGGGQSAFVSASVPPPTRAPNPTETSATSATTSAVEPPPIITDTGANKQHELEWIAKVKKIMVDYYTAKRADKLNGLQKRLQKAGDDRLQIEALYAACKRKAPDLDFVPFNITKNSKLLKYRLEATIPGSEFKEDELTDGVFLQLPTEAADVGCFPEVPVTQTHPLNFKKAEQDSPGPALPRPAPPRPPPPTREPLGARPPGAQTLRTSAVPEEKKSDLPATAGIRLGVRSGNYSTPVLASPADRTKPPVSALPPAAKVQTNLNLSFETPAQTKSPEAKQPYLTPATTLSFAPVVPKNRRIPKKSSNPLMPPVNRRPPAASPATPAPPPAPAKNPLDSTWPETRQWIFDQLFEIKGYSKDLSNLVSKMKLGPRLEESKMAIEALRGELRKSELAMRKMKSEATSEHKEAIEAISVAKAIVEGKEQGCAAENEAMQSRKQKLEIKLCDLEDKIDAVQEDVEAFELGRDEERILKLAENAFEANEERVDALEDRMDALRADAKEKGLRIKTQLSEPASPKRSGQRSGQSSPRSVYRKLSGIKQFMTSGNPLRSPLRKPMRRVQRIQVVAQTDGQQHDEKDSLEAEGPTISEEQLFANTMRVVKQLEAQVQSESSSALVVATPSLAELGRERGKPPLQHSVIWPEDYKNTLGVDLKVDLGKFGRAPAVAPALPPVPPAPKPRSPPKPPTIAPPPAAAEPKPSPKKKARPALEAPPPAATPATVTLASTTPAAAAPSGGIFATPTAPSTGLFSAPEAKRPPAEEKKAEESKTPAATTSFFGNTTSFGNTTPSTPANSNLTPAQQKLVEYEKRITNIYNSLPNDQKAKLPNALQKLRTKFAANPHPFYAKLCQKYNKPAEPPFTGTASTGGFGATSNSGGFGSTSGFGTTTSSGGGFGSTPTSGGGFGSNTTSTGGFGSNTTSGGFGPTTNTSSGGALFGSSSSGGGFGGATTSSSGGFGSSSGGFGGATTSSASGGFGGATTSGFGSSSGGGFGSSSGGGFGSSTNSSGGNPQSNGNPQTNGFGAFGGNNNNSSGGGFGSTTNNSGGGGGFGAFASTPNSNSGGGFGVSSNPGNSIFGSSGGGTSLFGNNSSSGNSAFTAFR